MSTITQTSLSLYETAIEQVIEGQERLPSLPTLTFQIRKAATAPNTTIPGLCNLISKDPSLSVLLMRHANSPVYKTVEAVKNLEGAVRVMGIPLVTNVVMSHSLSSLFVSGQPRLRELFAITWKRLTLKANIARFISRQTRLHDPEHVFMACILSEVGTLAIFSALGKVQPPPDQKTYLGLCRTYNRSLSQTILDQWSLDDSYTLIAKDCGLWKAAAEGSFSGKLSELDLVDLGLYHGLKLMKNRQSLPSLETLACYQNLPLRCQQLSDDGLLSVVKNNLAEILRNAKAFE